MPVTGHLFTGLATGLLFTDRSLKGSSAKKTATVVSLLALLAYLPDISARLLLISGWAAGRDFSHSLFGGVCISLPVGFLISRAGVLPFKTGLFLALLSLLLHDLLDFFHSADRLPLWPLPLERSGLGLQRLFSGTLEELLFYGALYSLFLVFVFSRVRSQGTPSSHFKFIKGSGPAVWGHRGITLLIVVMALFTSLMRERRETQLLDAKQAIREGYYRDALALIKLAGRWPSNAKPGRLTYLEGQVYFGLGESGQGEKLLLNSFVQNPRYFWCVLDLAMFYASLDLPRSTRSQLSAPYVKLLKEEFSEIDGIAGYLTKLERRVIR